MSIPVVKPFIKRKDMDAVLTCLVEDHVGPGMETEALVGEVQELCHCVAGIAFRDPESCWRILFDALKKSGVKCLAVCALAPVEILRAANAAGIELVLGDTLVDMPILDRAALDALSRPIDGLVMSYTCGYVPDLEAYAEYFRSRNLLVIEDASHAFCHDLLIQGLNEKKEGLAGEGLDLAGTRAESDVWPGSKTVVPGSIGTYVVVQTEFDSLLTTGGGCVLLMRDASAAALVQPVRDLLPASAFMGDMNAALGRAQLKSLPEMLGRRMELHASFRSALMRGRQKTFHSSHGHFPHSFAVLVQSSVQDVQAFARKKGIETEFAFNGCILQQSGGDAGESARTWPRAYGMMLRTLLFPLHCGLHQKDIELIQKVLPSLP